MRAGFQRGVHASRDTSLSRFGPAKARPEQSIGLSPTHPAIVEGRTLSPSTVVGAMASPRFLVSGANNPKLGKEVRKGPRTGWPIFQLSLEERATCPRSCGVWRECYGNAMHQARRHDHRDPLFMELLRAEVITTARANPNGVLVRLHTLGDFYSVPYVKLWADLLDLCPSLHIFGYTARSEDADDDESRRVAKAVRWLTEQAWDRFAIRFSRAVAVPQGSVVVDSLPDDPDIIVCPAQTGATKACATCGLCWADAAREKTIAFLRHGMVRATGPRAVREPKPTAKQAWRGGHGRPVIGALPGETKEARDVRVIAWIEANPDTPMAEAVKELGITDKLYLRLLDSSAALKADRWSRRRGPVFMPRQVFTPAPPPPATPAERLAATPADIRREIERRYGCAPREAVR